MAEEFLRQLTKSKPTELPEDDRQCMICQHQYGMIGPASEWEHPIWLPCCKRHVGNKCIETWLAPSKEAQDSCPHCRNTLFILEPLYPSSRFSVRYFVMDRLRLYGYTLQERGWQFNREQATLMPAEGAMAAAGLVSRQVLSSRRQPSFSSLLHRNAYVENVAYAISSLELREKVLYYTSVVEGVQLPSFHPLQPMGGIQEAEFLNQLDRLGAFDEFSEWMSSEGLQKIEVWRLLRREGKAYQVVTHAGGRRVGNWFSF
ncbi:hypothetical protein N7G274_002831 [Stereocaulon virgatum]|uniref:RING-type domain-containing protein n=1 Tax=Stereocaulon virgatum TaxID=373712 RepID=A0ABR4AHR3_9LECA